MEGLSQDSSRCLTEEDPARVDADDLICAWTLLNAVAVVIELTERCAEVVQIVTEDVGAQVIDDTADDLWEANHSFSKLQYNGGEHRRWAAILVWSGISCAVRAMNLEYAVSWTQLQSSIVQVS